MSRKRIDVSTDSQEWSYVLPELLLQIGKAYTEECKEFGYNAIRATIYVLPKPGKTKPCWYVEEMRCFEDGKGKVIRSANFNEARKKFDQEVERNIRENENNQEN